MLRTLLLGLLVWAPRPGHAGLANLNCELILAPYQVVPGVTTRVGRDEIVIRGHLEANRYFSPHLQVRYGVRDTEGYDRVFAAPADTLHYLEPGDRVFLLTGQGRLFLHGYYDERLQLVTVDWTGEFQDVRLAQPGLYDDPKFAVSRLSTDRFIELFAEYRQAVVIKRISDEVRQRLQARLGPQIALHQAHEQDPKRFVAVGAGRPAYELRVFETKVEGRLKDGHPNFPQRTKRDIYAIDLRLVGAKAPIAIRRGDRLFILDENDELLFEYVAAAQPLLVRMPEPNEDTLKLLNAIGRESRTILIRQVGR